jgi:hypothetical protein
MGCYSFLGIEICIPSLDDIINAVVAPITNFVTSSLSGLVSTLTPLFDSLGETLGSFAGSLATDIAGAVVTIGSSVASVIETLGSAVSNAVTSLSGALETLGSSVEGVINSIGSAVQTQIVATSNTLAAGINTVGSAIQTQIELTANTLSAGLDNLGSSLSGMIEAGGQAMITAFDGMGNAISGVLGGMFSGFGSVDISSAGASALMLTSLSSSSLTAAAARHSPMTPNEAWAEAADLMAAQRDVWYQLYIMALVIEGASLGQVDGPSTMLMQEPSVAAANKLAIEWYAARWEIGVAPLLERFFLAAYQPNIPSYGDMIEIYVREGYLESHWVELPAEMVENFKELGYSEEWTKRLWGKHWVYPSPTQLYEMLHRSAGNFPEIGVTSDVLKEMLKLHDFEPMWRGPLEAISWNTWRIYDIRTGWEMDLLSDEGLLKRTIDSGYEPKDAEILVNIQKMFVLRSEIDGLLGESDTDFIAGWISEDQLKVDYGATPYNPSIIELRIAKAKLRQERTDKADLKAALINRYTKGDLSESEFAQELSRLGIQQNRISVEVTKANATKLKTVKEDTTVTNKALTEATYNRAFKVGLISETEYRKAMAAYKYSSEDIDLLVQLNTPAKPAPEEIKTLTVAELKSAFRVGVLSEEELRAELETRRYSPKDIDLMIETEKAKIKPKEGE